MWLRRPKTCKLGKRWTGPFVILNRMGVNHKIQSSSGTLVAHHDQLKLHYAPTGPRNIFCPEREHGDFAVVDNDPVAAVVHPVGLLVPPPAPPVPRCRPARLRPNVRPPAWHQDYIL